MKSVFLITWASLALAFSTSGTASEIDGITRKFLAECVAAKKAAIVIGLVDERGSSVFGTGTLDNDSTLSVDGDSVFFIGSVTKTFTALLLLKMAQRGEVQLDDPVSKYLEANTRMPALGNEP